jgi:hypothetical protein
VVLDSLAIMVIIVSYILFASLIAFILFSSTTENDDGFFDDIPATFFNTYVLFTTSNFPDIMIPFWPKFNSSALFFITFLVVGLYMLMNLMLAVFYNSYKTQTEKKIEKYD